MVKWESKRVGDLLVLAIGLALAVLINQLGSRFFTRLDFTEEQRYSIKPSTQKLLHELDDDVYVEVFLEGDLNAGFRRLRRNVREVLEEFRVQSGNRVHYSFTDPQQAKGQQAQREFMSSLAARGVSPMNVIDNQDGQRIEKLVFPGAIVSYAGAEQGVMLLKNKWTQTAQEKLNESIEEIEFELANTILKLSQLDTRRIGIVRGHGETDSLHTYSLVSALRERYLVRSVVLSASQAPPTDDVLVVIKPVTGYSEQDKYKLDQFVMRGGRLLVLMDELEATPDSASRDDYFAFPYKTRLEDLLFKYGVRVNPDLIQDRVAMKYPVVTNVVNGRPQITPLDWPFFPLVNRYADHPITRNLDASYFRFVSSLDTVKATGIRKFPLVFTSQYSRRLTAPVKVSINDIRKETAPDSFSDGEQVVSYLLEGPFSSLYKNRFKPDGVDTTGYRDSGVHSKVVVVSDGDLARNEINLKNGQPLPVGLDQFSGYRFANGDLLLNMISYLAEPDGLINARSREVKIRPLDKEKIKDSRGFWQLVNVAAPVLLIVLLALARAFWRKKRYTTFQPENQR